MNLIVFPGASDPNHPHYSDAYKLIKEEADKRVIDIQIVTYPGHDSHHTPGLLTVKSAANTIKKTLEKQEELGQLYSVFVRSFGCFPFLKVIQNNRFDYLERAIVWGASPYYTYYDATVVHIEESITKALKKGYQIPKDIFQGIYPIELSVKHLGELNFQVYFTSGEKDKIYTKEFHETLKSLNSNPKVNFPNLISGVGHVVQDYNEEYLNLLFSNY